MNGAGALTVKLRVGGEKSKPHQNRKNDNDQQAVTRDKRWPKTEICAGRLVDGRLGDMFARRRRRERRHYRRQRLLRHKPHRRSSVIMVATSKYQATGTFCHSCYCSEKSNLVSWEAISGGVPGGDWHDRLLLLLRELNRVWWR